MKNLASVLLLSLLLTACATAPTPDQLRNADYGPEIQDYKEVVKDRMKKFLKDPSSATYEFSPIGPRKGWAGGGLSGPVQYGYIVCATINAKNSFGAYVGAKKYFILIRNYDLIVVDDNPYTTEKAC